MTHVGSYWYYPTNEEWLNSFYLLARYEVKRFHQTGRISLFTVCEIHELSPVYLVKINELSNKLFFTKSELLMDHLCSAVAFSVLF